MNKVSWKRQIWNREDSEFLKMDLSFVSGDNKIYSSKEAIENRNCLLERNKETYALSDDGVFCCSNRQKVQFRYLEK